MHVAIVKSYLDVATRTLAACGQLEEGDVAARVLPALAELLGCRFGLREWEKDRTALYLFFPAVGYVYFPVSPCGALGELYPAESGCSF